MGKNKFVYKILVLIIIVIFASLVIAPAVSVIIRNKQIKKLQAEENNQSVENAEGAEVVVEEEGVVE